MNHRISTIGCVACVLLMMANQVSAMAPSVKLETLYIDGTKETVIISMEEAEQKQKGNPKIIMQQNEDGTWTMKECQSRLHPEVAKHGYFGISPDGILTIYNGTPKEEQAIQSYYELQVEELETDVRNKLQSGIPVVSVANFLNTIQSLQMYQ
ncbi:MAG: BofC C-terminal domain-containing protein [Bacilli bacterium]